MSSIDADFLSRFSDPDRPRLASPMNCGGYTWATNGPIIVRVPEIPGLPDCEIDLPAIWEENVNCILERVEIPMIPVPPAGDVPEGEESAYCSKCKGNGATFCPHCEQAMECTACDGTGGYIERRWQEIGGAAWAVKLLQLFTQLPEGRTFVCMRAHDFVMAREFSGGAALLLAWGRSADMDPAREWKPAATNG